MSDAAEAKVAGAMPGELLRDLGDERLLAAHPRPPGMDDATYLAQLQAKGLAVVVSRAGLASGGYARAKAKAVVDGAVVIVPYEPDELAPGQAGGSEGADSDFDYVRWRADYERARREGRSPYER